MKRHHFHCGFPQCVLPSSVTNKTPFFPFNPNSSFYPLPPPLSQNPVLLSLPPLYIPIPLPLHSARHLLFSAITSVSTTLSEVYWTQRISVDKYKTQFSRGNESVLANFHYWIGLWAPFWNSFFILTSSDLSQSIHIFIAAMRCHQKTKGKKESIKWETVCWRSRQTGIIVNRAWNPRNLKFNFQDTEIIFCIIQEHRISKNAEHTTAAKCNKARDVIGSEKSI